MYVVAGGENWLSDLGVKGLTMRRFFKGPMT